jgi:chromosome segregation ATPase
MADVTVDARADASEGAARDVQADDVQADDAAREDVVADDASSEANEQALVGAAIAELGETSRRLAAETEARMTSMTERLDRAAEEMASTRASLAELEAALARVDAMLARAADGHWEETVATGERSPTS